MVDEIIELGRLESNYRARQETVKAAGKKDTFKADVRDALVNKFGASDATVRVSPLSLPLASLPLPPSQLTDSGFAPQQVLAADRLKNPKLHTFFVTPPVKPQYKVTPDEKMAYEDSVIHARNEGQPIAAAFAIADVKLRLAELDSPPVDKSDTAHKVS